MTDEHVQEATRLAKQAKGEAKAAARETGRAAKVIAEPVTEAVADEARDAVRAVRSLPTSRVTMGVLALGIALGTGAFVLIKRQQTESEQTSVVVSD